MAIILVIAGFDPTGGAGLQADLKTITVLGEVGLTVATALTVQDTQGVEASYVVEKKIVKQQLDRLFSDFSIDAVKIGMLPNAEMVNFIGERFSQHHLPHIVIDPVIRAKKGFILNKATEALVKLFPLAELITPNLDEIEVFLGKKPESLEEMKEAAKKLKNFGAKAILVKGGELKTATDVLFDGSDFYIWEVTKRQLKLVHGTGCVLSSAIATFLAKGLSLPDAVGKAKKFITLAIEGALSVGKGNLLSHPYAWVEQEIAKYEVISALKRALNRLQEAPYVSPFVPEVRSNLVYALPYAKTYDQVAAFSGRLSVVEGKVVACGPPEFGVSQHMASVVLKAMEFDREYRSAMNIKYRDDFIKKAEKLGYKIQEIVRKDEPSEIKSVEGLSLPWITERAIKQFGSLPDLVYDKGDIGKEAIIRVLGKHPEEVAQKVIKLAMEVFKYA
ncbi:MAG: Bifunctional thiamine biosynthesis protein ThiDN [Candidatus Methanoperedenaceae archaeon GB50]|nr:MAG: Bifunctional thiamine biosynthesis protein ThiDN [Candidatus Methanoperedenaceae archaeon GB50]